jgi:hypothetical protein
MSQPSSTTENPSETAQVDSAVTRLSVSPWFSVGKNSSAAFANRKDWLFRRVESVAFVGRRSVRRCVSVDFEIPKGLPGLRERGRPGDHLVPISVFQKWPPLMEFSLYGPDGLPASLYTRATNKQIDFGLLKGMIELTLAKATQPLDGSPTLPDELDEELALLVAQDQPHPVDVEYAAYRLESELKRLLADTLATASQDRFDEVQGQIVETVDLAARLSNYSVLWIPVAGTPGTDRIAKFSYIDVFRMGTPWWRRFLTACSWLERSLSIQLPHAGRHTRYHLDVEGLSDGVELIGARAIGFPSAARETAGTAGQGERQHTTDSAVARDSDRQDPTPGDVIGKSSSQIVDRNAHIYLSHRAAPSHRIVLQLKLAATRSSFISGCVIASIAIAVLLSVTFVELPAAADHLEPIVVLLAAVPVVLGYVLVRPGERLLERYHIVGVRAMAMLSGAMPILGALTLVLTRNSDQDNALPDVRLAKLVWGGLLMTSWILVVGLVVSWLFAAAPSQLGERSSDDADEPQVDSTGTRLSVANALRPWCRRGPVSGLLAGTALVIGSIVECQPYTHVSRLSLASYYGGRWRGRALHPHRNHMARALDSPGG